MWTAERLLSEAVGGRVGERFVGLDEVDQLSVDELVQGAAQVLARPQKAEFIPGARPLSRRLLAAQWTLVLEAAGLPAQPRVLELCAGGSDPVVVALDVLFGGEAEYITVNLNRKLADELLARLAGLELRARIIEDDAQNVPALFPEPTFDCVCFHHAVNDILETAVAEAHGWDTRDLDWWPNERQMIEWLEMYASDAPDLTEFDFEMLRSTQSFRRRKSLYVHAGSFLKWIGFQGVKMSKSELLATMKLVGFEMVRVDARNEVGLRVCRAYWTAPPESLSGGQSESAA